jgi:putative tryptophan/tyrosine transport system substrate-binding protein
VVPLATAAQQAGKVARIGWLVPFRPGPRSGFDVFRQAMRELGWVEGQNLVIEFRFAALQDKRFPELSAELVRLQPDVIIAHTTLSALAAKSATTTIPIVMIFVDDAVSEGLVASLAHPSGNLTGLSMPYTEVSGKRLEFLRQMVPHLARVAVLYNPTYPAMARSVRETQVAAQALGVTLQLVEVRDPSAFEDAFAAMTRAHAEALLVLIDPLVNDHRGRIADLAIRSQLPMMADERGQVEAGGLMGYGVYWPDVIRRAAYYVDRLLKGAKPADLPVEQVTKLDLVLNLKTAQALGLTIPPTLLFQADEVLR